MTGPSNWRQLHPLLEQFEQAWRSGPPALGEFVEKAEESLQFEAALELAKIDIDHRIHKHLALDLSDYARQAPRLRARWAEALAELEHARRSSEGHWQTTSGLPAGQDPDSSPAVFGGRYQVIGEIAVGGEATVYRCVDRRDVHGVVAVKWMRPGVLDPKRFLLQMQTMREMGEVPNVVRLFDWGEEEGRPYIVSEYVRGSTIRDYVQDRSVPPDSPQPPVAPEVAVRLVLAIARAAARGHAIGITHQDLTPRNVLIDEAGEPVLIDFGLAWVRQAWGDGGSLSAIPGGTPQFISPEQARLLLNPHAGTEVGRIEPRTDVFGLGMLLYFMLTGQHPYTAAGSVEETLRLAASGEQGNLRLTLERKKMPPRLRRICLRAIAPSAQDRYSSADELAGELERLNEPGSWRRLWLWPAAAVVFCLLAVVGWRISPWRERPAVTATETLSLQVRVYDAAKKTYVPLTDVLPLKTGSEVQVRFRAPAGMHCCLVSVNGSGRLTLLKEYRASDRPAEVIWPEPGAGVKLRPPAGTEFLFVCARARSPVSLSEVQSVWDIEAAWPVWGRLNRLLRVRPDRMSEEGTRGRDFGEEVARPEADPLGQRLERFRDRLREDEILLVGVAFRHIDP